METTMLKREHPFYKEACRHVDLSQQEEDGLNLLVAHLLERIDALGEECDAAYAGVNDADQQLRELKDLCDQLDTENSRLLAFTTHCRFHHSLPDCCCPEV